MILLLFIILIILYTQVKLYEKFTCNSNPFFVEKLFRPLSVHTSDNQTNENTIDNYHFLITPDNINKLIKKIPLKKFKTEFQEIRPNKYSYYNYGYIGYKYNKKSLKNTILKLYKVIKHNFEKNISINHPKLCNKHVICTLQLLDIRIISLGINNNELSINGQLYLKFNSSSYTFILNFLISEFNNHLNIYRITLTDIGLLSNQDNEHYDNNLYLLSSPLYGIYDAKNTYLYSSYESDEFDNKDILNYMNNDNLDHSNDLNKINEQEYRCYGNQSIDKYDCENLYDINGKKKK